LSQTEFGQVAGLHYTHIGRFERGASRPSGDTLKRLSDALGVSSDCLLDGATDEAAKARFEDRELLRPFQEVEHLPDEDKNVVKKLLDTFLVKKQLQAMAR
jgi:transcriptional regulator with XRE-family HTH domain